MGTKFTWLRVFAVAAIVTIATFANQTIAYATGNITFYSDSSMANALPMGIVQGSDGNIWWINRKTQQGGFGPLGPAAPTDHSNLDSLNLTTGVITSYTNPNTMSPTDIISGPDGNLWFTNSPFNGGGSIAKFDINTHVYTFYTDAANISDPQYLITGPDGNIWFTNYRNNTIGRINPSTGAVTSFGPASSNYSGPAAITLGPDGNIWYTNETGSVGRITPSGGITIFADSGITQSYGIAPGADGALWFTVYRASGQTIGRVTTSGSFSYFSDPNIYFPQQLMAGPDGNLYFANGDSTNVIGVISPTGAISYITANPASSGATDNLAFSTSGNTLWFTSQTSGSTAPKIGSVSGFPSFPSGGGNGNSSSNGSSSSCTGNSAQNIACATVSVGGGTLVRLNSPDVNYAPVNLNGQAQITNANVAYQVEDATGSGGGWNMTLSATTFTNGSHTLPHNALSLNAPSAQVCVMPNCTPAANGVSGPIEVDTATSGGPVVKIFNATANTGMGEVETDTSTSLAVPANAYQGSYQSTWTLSLTSGP